MRRTLIMAGLLVASWAQGPAATAASAAEDLRALLPPETLAAVWIPDVARLWDRWERSPFYRFYGDPAAAGFFAPLTERIAQWRRRLTEERGIDPERLRRFFHGPLVLAAVAAPLEATPSVEWVLIFRHNGDPSILAALQRYQAPGVVRVERTAASHAGLAYTHLRVTHELEAPLTPPRRGASAAPGPVDRRLDGLPGVRRADASPVKRQEVHTFDDYFGPDVIVHAGTAGRPIEAVLERLAASDAALPSWADWLARQGLLDTAPGDDAGDALVFVDVTALAGRWRAAEGGVLGAVARALQLGEIRAAGAALTLEPRRASLRVQLLAPPPRRGAARALFPEAAQPPDAARLVPPEALMYDATQWPIAELWSTARAALAELWPEMDRALEAQLAALAQQGGVDWERDVLARLGPGVVQFRLPAAGRRPATEWTGLIAARDAAALAPAIDRTLAFVAQRLGLLDSRRLDRAGRPLWALYTRAPGATLDAAAPPPDLYLSLTDGWLMVSTGTAGMEAVLRRQTRGAREPSLAESPAFREAMALLPTPRVQESFTDPAMWATAAQRADQVLARGTGVAARTFDPRLAPDAALWRRYFGPMAAARQVDGDRVRIQVYLAYASPGGAP